MNFMELIQRVPNEQAGVLFLQERGLILKERTCKEGHDMVLSLKYLRWVCYKCKHKIRIRTGTWLECTRLPIHKMIYFIYCWSEGLTTVKFCKKELKLAQASVIEYNYNLREVCVWRLMKDSGMTLVNRDVRETHKSESAWRKSLDGKDPFEEILHDLSEFRPPNN